MEGAMQVGSVMGPVLFVLGLSMLFYAKSWVKVIDQWYDNHYSLVSMMIMFFVFGLVSLQIYSEWDWGPGLIVTLLGWGMVLDSVIVFLLPGDVVKSVLKMKKNVGIIYFGGIVTAVLGGVLGYYSYFA